MEVCERNSCVCVTIATRDVVTGEEQLESLNVKLPGEDNESQVAMRLL